MGRGRRRRGQPHAGVLLVDKPQGLTSFALVERVRRAVGADKAGHTGTLDPMATGLLPVCLGATTRLARFISDADKGYRATMLLGVRTDSLDADGAVVDRAPDAAVAAIDAAAVEAAMQRFLGPITQVPPAFSAIKVEGERLYDKARRGEAVEAPPRAVTIHRLALVDAAPPRFTFDVGCSKGTYVRTLAADIGDALGVGAHLVALRRTAIGALRVDDALPLDAIEADPAAALARRLDAAAAIRHLPAVTADAAAVTDLRCGRRRAFADAPRGPCAVLDPAGVLVAIIDAAGLEPAEILRGFPPPTDRDA
ncbi:MAG: tRNA pseudouridine(55) synthase TruB [Myxococcales bacterium]|nr:tRNA pseudouridine(55) synthase TruB [Myxococcales bacterium]